jgi:hypothetical protein
MGRRRSADDRCTPSIDAWVRLPSLCRPSPRAVAATSLGMRKPNHWYGSTGACPEAEPKDLSTWVSHTSPFDPHAPPHTVIQNGTRYTPPRTVAPSDVEESSIWPLVAGRSSHAIPRCLPCQLDRYCGGCGFAPQGFINSKTPGTTGVISCGDRNSCGAGNPFSGGTAERCVQCVSIERIETPKTRQIRFRGVLKRDRMGETGAAGGWGWRDNACQDRGTDAWQGVAWWMSLLRFTVHASVSVCAASVDMSRHSGLCGETGSTHAPNVGRADPFDSAASPSLTLPRPGESTVAQGRLHRRVFAGVRVPWRR